MKSLLKILSILLAAAIFIPTAQKLAHTLEDVDHEICEGLNQHHYHQLELDCEFEKFTFNNFYGIELQDYQFIQIECPEYKIPVSENRLKSSYQDSAHSRGPPYWV